MPKMSTDRVRFVFRDNGDNREATLDAAREAFNVSPSIACNWWRTEATIVCRPSQFARFIIHRGENVSNQAMKQFKAELFMPEDATVADVSKNPKRDEYGC